MLHTSRQPRDVVMASMTHLHPYLSPPRTLVFAHRGASGVAPENTLAAFDRAVALGADGLELDVRLSRDGVPVVHHDRLLGRTSDGVGPVAEWNADDLAAVDAGFRFGEGEGHPYRGRGLGIPRLAEILARYPGVRLIVEMKVDDEEMARATLGAVRRAGALDRVCFGSFGSRVLREIRRLAPAAVTSASRHEARLALYGSWLGLAPRHPPYGVYQVPERSRAGHRVVSSRFVRVAHRAGLLVEVWTVNRADAMWRLLEWGVDDLITDRPDIALPIARAWRDAHR
jgi:glycerophosphoryl diester phosphodiesterase